MSTVTHGGDVDGGYEAATDTELHEHHPSDGLYWRVGAILGVLTLLEVGTYFVTDDPYTHELKWLLIGGLLTLMVVKFITIISYFMHLKFDNKLFRNVFISGLVLAVGVYIVVLTTFAFWDSGYEADNGPQDAPAAEAGE
jgi:cytochrome c oxidase subunit 4